MTVLKKSTIQWNSRLATYECTGCMCVFEIKHAVQRNPEKLLMWKEAMEAAHRPCAEIAAAVETANRIRQAWGLELAEATRQ